MPQIRVGGIYGVGKTTVIDESLEYIIKKYNVTIPKIKGSEIMARILGVHYDLLPEQPAIARRQARKLMYEEIAKIPYGIRDGHFSVITEQKEFEFPQSDIDKMCVGALVVITATAPVIAKRRAALGRAHRSTHITDILTHQDVEVKAAKELSKSLDIPLYVIDNSQSSTIAVNRMSDIIMEHYQATVPHTAEGYNHAHY